MKKILFKIQLMPLHFYSEWKCINSIKFFERLKIYGDKFVLFRICLICFCQLLICPFIKMSVAPWSMLNHNHDITRGSSRWQRHFLLQVFCYTNTHKCLYIQIFFFWEQRAKFLGGGWHHGCNNKKHYRLKDTW